MAINDERDDHKYVARVHMKTVKGKKVYRYFYDLAEYKAYLGNNKQATPTESSIENTKTESSNKSGKKTKTSFLEKLEKVAKPIIETGKKFVEDLAKSAKTANTNVAKGGKNFVKSVVKAIDKTVDNVVEDGKEVISEVTKTGKAFLDYVLLNKPKPKNKTFSKDEDMEVVNPRYDPTDYGTSQNCAYCTAAYDLRRRGYDVEAIEKSIYTDLGITPSGKEHLQTTPEHILSWYEDPEFVTSSIITDKYDLDAKDNLEDVVYCIEHSLREYGEDSYGHFFMFWPEGGGHDVIWSIENDSVVLRDTQSNKKYTLLELAPYMADFGYFRSDNLELNERIYDVVTNR